MLGRSRSTTVDDRLTAGISIEGVSKRFGAAHVLRSLNLEAEPGSFLCLLGPSGCGKTTLLRCIAGLERPDEGRISIGATTVVDTGRKLTVPPERRGLGMVFQQYALWPHMSIADNIAYPLRKRGMARPERDRRVREIADVVGLSATLDRPPRQLSGGQQQRAALARALVHEPPALLLDEPLSNVDATLRRQLRRELRDLHERLGTTCILVTHDQEEAAAVADIVAVIQDGEVVQAGTSREILESPGTRFVAEFVGFDNFVTGTVQRTTGSQAVVALTGGFGRVVAALNRPAAPGDDVVVAARSDTLAVTGSQDDEGDQAVRAKLTHVTPRGSGLEFELTVGPQILTVHQHQHADTTHAAGDEVLVRFPATCRAVPA